MKKIKNKLSNYIKITELLDEICPNNFVDVSYEVVDDKGLSMLSGLSLFIEQTKPFKFGYILAILNQKSKTDLTMEDFEDFLEIHLLFSNQMDKILPNYNSGWDVSSEGLKLKEEHLYNSWDQVAEYIEKRATFYGIEELMFM